MNLRRARTVYFKELTDIVRDHRTLAAMVIVPIVLYPLIMLGGIQAVSVQGVQLEEEKIVLGFAREADWEDVIKPLLVFEQAMVNRMRIEARADGAAADQLNDIPVPLAERLADPRGPFADLDAAVRQHLVHCGVVVENRGWVGRNTQEQVHVRLKYQPENVRGEFAAHRLKEALERVAEHRTETRLQMLNVDKRILKPVVLEEDLLTTPGSVLGLILPLILVLMTITGAIYPAIDLTAGERERGTLESLMVCPVPVIDLIIGKFLVVATVAIAGAALNLASVTATVYFGGIEGALTIGKQSEAGAFPLQAIPIVLASLIPFAVFMSAIMIAVCSCARTFKEAQNYVTPLIITVVVLGGIAALPGASLRGVMVVTPVANMVLLTRELFSGARIEPSAFFWVLLSTSLYAATAVGIAAQVFGRESVVFSDTVSLGTLLNRGMVKPVGLPSLTMVGLYTALLFPLWFHVQGLLQLPGGVDMTRVLGGTTIAMPICFVVIPYAVLKWRKVDSVRTFALRRPRWTYLAAAVAIGLSAWIPTHELFVVQRDVVADPAGVEAMNEAILKAFKSLPVVSVFVFAAFVPALCEELFFRGFLFGGLRTAMRPWAAIVCSGVAFAVFHFLVFRFLATALLGVLFAWMCWRSRSIWPGVLAHVLHNGLLTAAVVWPGALKSFGLDDENAWGHLPAPVLVGGAAVFLAGMLLAAWGSGDAADVAVSGGAASSAAVSKRQTS